jgi:hypothetical protein
MEINSLEAVLEYLNKNEITDERIYATLAPTNIARLQALLKRFTQVAGAKHNKSGAKKKMAWTAQQRRLKGRCFEQMMKTLLPPVFSKWDRVQTPTNELDILLVLGPRTRFFPALQEWGAYCICECKSNTNTFSVTWVDKLAGVLQKHGACVGFVMSQRTPKAMGNAGRALQSLRDYAILGQTIILVDLSDVQRCIDGHNALSLICTRYVETRLRLKKYRLIALAPS